MVAKFAAIAMAASAAQAVVGFAGGMAAAKTARRIGEANAQLAERDILVAENNKIALEQKLQLDLERADIDFAGLQSETAVAYRYSGVDMTEGTPLDRLIRNVGDFEFDKKIAEYNVKIAQQEQDELAAFAQMKANISRLTGASQAQLYRTKAYGSLLGGAVKTAQLGAKYFP